ncbi:hypothetical protein D9M69_710890 [compost metagenome]
MGELDDRQNEDEIEEEFREGDLAFAGGSPGAQERGMGEAFVIRRRHGGSFRLKLLQPPVRHDPHECDRGVDEMGDDRRDEGKPDRGEIEER